LSGGTWLNEADATKWATALTRLARAASGAGIERQPIRVRFAESLKLPPREIDWWNRVWPKRDPQTIATVANDSTTLAAQQRLGLGHAIAIAFEPRAAELATILDRWQNAPVDPRLNLSWDVGGPTLRVRVDAFDPGSSQFLNGLKLSLQLGGTTTTLQQTSPGRYQLEAPAPRQATVATVVLATEPGAVVVVVARRAIAGRYAPEFERLGNDRAALRELARRSGGRVIEPSDAGRIDLETLAPRRRIMLTSWFATFGALSLAVGLIVWKRR
jgi:hypothetical protein